MAELVEPRRKAYAKLDLDHDGKLSFEEWAVKTIDKFNEADADKSKALTPTEFAGFGDWVACEHRPSHNTPEARRLRVFNITRLILCGSSSFRPIGSIPGLLNPLQPRGWTGTRLFRREPPNSTSGTCTHEQHTLRGLLRGGRGGGRLCR